uniref:Uncharacterized protein n=1 Tax=mine drainage metagenome TaxID=410659 RepID=E6QHB4_9ZZZZ
MQNLICGKADRVLDAFGFQELVHIRLREGCVATEGDTFHRSLVACNDRLENVFPPIGAMHVAGSERASLQIPELVEHEERMKAGATEMPVPHALLLLAMRWADA